MSVDELLKKAEVNKAEALSKAEDSLREYLEELVSDITTHKARKQLAERLTSKLCDESTPFNRGVILVAKIKEIYRIKGMNIAEFVY